MHLHFLMTNYTLSYYDPPECHCIHRRHFHPGTPPERLPRKPHDAIRRSPTHNVDSPGSDPIDEPHGRCSPRRCCPPRVLLVRPRERPRPHLQVRSAPGACPPRALCDRPDPRGDGVRLRHLHHRCVSRRAFQHELGVGIRANPRSTLEATSTRARATPRRASSDDSRRSPETRFFSDKNEPGCVCR